MYERHDIANRSNLWFKKAKEDGMTNDECTMFEHVTPMFFALSMISTNGINSPDVNDFDEFMDNNKFFENALEKYSQT